MHNNVLICCLHFAYGENILDMPGSYDLMKLLSPVQFHEIYLASCSPFSTLLHAPPLFSTPVVQHEPQLLPFQVPIHRSLEDQWPPKTVSPTVLIMEKYWSYRLRDQGSPKKVKISWYPCFDCGTGMRPILLRINHHDLSRQPLEVPLEESSPNRRTLEVVHLQHMWGHCQLKSCTTIWCIKHLSKHDPENNGQTLLYSRYSIQLLMYVLNLPG